MSTKSPLDGLYPDAAQTFFSTRLPENDQLLADEIPLTASMVAKRRTEFMHGRYCARAAMEKLNLQPAAIGKGPNREPVWPAGITGSISHTRGTAGAVVARCGDIHAVGLDMEENEPLQPELLPMICLPSENPQENGERAKLLFSIKESIYKCIFPLVRQYVDFLEIEVCVDADTHAFSARPRADWLNPVLINRIQGRYKYHAQLVISAAWITQPDFFAGQE